MIFQSKFAKAEDAAQRVLIAAEADVKAAEQAVRDKKVIHAVALAKAQAARIERQQAERAQLTQGAKS